MLNKKYNSPEEEVRTELSFKEVARRIKIIYQAELDSSRPNFDAWDQLLACESLSESSPIAREYLAEPNENPSVSGMVNGGYKLKASFELTQSKQKIIYQLSKCTYRTAPIEIASLLEEFFMEWKSEDPHWLFVAQHWNPREINRTLNQIIKLQTSGRLSIQNPSAFFTYKIKFRAKKK